MLKITIKINEKKNFFFLKKKQFYFIFYIFIFLYFIIHLRFCFYSPDDSSSKAYSEKSIKLE